MDESELSFCPGRLYPRDSSSFFPSRYSKMIVNPEHNGAVPSSVAAAVLVQSNEMPAGSQTVEELDFNKFAGRPITVDDLMSGMNNMGFQATSIGEAVRIINDMVCTLPPSIPGIPH